MKKGELMNIKHFFTASLVTLLLLFVVSCGRNNEQPQEDDVETDAVQETEGAEPTPTPTTETAPAPAPVPLPPAPLGSALILLDEMAQRFPSLVSTGATHVDGTTLYVGVASANPWAGIIGGAVFHDAASDGFIAEPLGTASSIFSTNEFLQFGQEGIATWEIDVNARTFTINQVMDVYWHDGVPLTLDDLVFALEIIAHPDYSGIHFTAENQAITGIMDYHRGFADSVSGLNLSNNNRTLVINFDVLEPGLLHFGLWSAPTPRHVFEGIPVREMANSNRARISPVGWGPFIVSHVVPGESVSMVRNPNFVFGEAVVERIEFIRVAPEAIAASMHYGLIDIACHFPAADFTFHQLPSSFRYIGAPTGEYSYIAFRLGHWDFANRINIFTPTRKMSDAGPLFRQAMAYAIDPGFIGWTLHGGLHIPARTNIPPNHRAFIDPHILGFPFDPARARELLDEAGFDQFDDEGMRLGRNGERFTVYWAFMENPITQNIVVPFFIGQWAAVGIRVELWRGTTHPTLTLWDYIDFDDDGDEIDIVSGAWNVGKNPNPGRAWGHFWWNPSRYTSPTFDGILARMSSQEAFDQAYMQQIFHDWQGYWQQNVPYIPLLWEFKLIPVNNRVTYWDSGLWNPGANPGSRWLSVGLSADLPVGRL